MAEQIEQLMRQVKLGGMAKGWRSVPYENTEQYVTDLLTLELQEREANRINRMVKTAGFRVMKTLDDFVWKNEVSIKGIVTKELLEELLTDNPTDKTIYNKMTSYFTVNIKNDLYDIRSEHYGTEMYIEITAAKDIAFFEQVISQYSDQFSIETL